MYQPQKFSQNRIDDDPPPMMDRPDDESSVDSDDEYCQQDYQDLNDASTDEEDESQEDYDLIQWLDNKEEKAYRSPMDSPPLKDMPCAETVDEDEDLPPHLREARDKFHTDRLKTGNEPPGIDLPPEEMIVGLIQHKDDTVVHSEFTREL
jgi:hypothetical protein